MKTLSLHILFILSLTSCLGQSRVKINSIRISEKVNYANSKNSDITTLFDGKVAQQSPMWLDQQTLGWTNKAKIEFDIDIEQTANIQEVRIRTGTNSKAGAFAPLNILLFVKNPAEDEYRYIGDFMESNQISEETPSGRFVSLKNIFVKSDRLRLIIVPNGMFFFTDEIEVLRTNRRTNKLGKYPMVPSSKINELIGAQKEEAIDIKFAKIQQLQGLKNTRVKSTAGTSVENVENFWDPNLSILSPISNDNLDWKLTSLENTSEYKSLKISNTSTKKQSYVFKSTAGVLLFDVQNIKTREFKLIPDVLQPLSLDQPLEIAAGESKILLFEFPLGAKQIAGNIAIYNAADNKEIAKINVEIDVLNYKVTEKLNANSWAYFNYPFVKVREKAVYNDLIKHYNNILVVPPNVLTEENRLLHGALKDYVANRNAFEKISLFLNFRNILKRGELEDKKWQSDFLKWYDESKSVLANLGFSDIYLYPYDELQPSEVETFNSFIKWIISQRKDAKFFVTVNIPNIINKVNNKVDICQIKEDNVVINEARSNKYIAEIWIYSTAHNTKGLSPYDYYRLQSWRAFFNDFKGVGFWNYADVGHKAGEISVWDDFDGTLADYAVVYDKGNQVISSRRWEAFKKGLEDYRLLVLHAKKYGTNKTKQLVKNVIDNTDNALLADQALEKIKAELR